MVYDPMQAIEAYGAGRAFRTRQDVGNALAAGNDRQAEQTAFRGGDVGTGMALRQNRQAEQETLRRAAAQMDAQQREIANQRIQRGTAILGDAARLQDPAQRQRVIAMGARELGLSREHLGPLLTDPSDENIHAALAQFGQLREIMGPEPAPTADMRNFQMAQENPEFAEYQMSQRRAGATSVTVEGPNLGRREDAFASATAERDAERQNAIFNAADAAPTNVRNVDILADTLLDEGVYTGTGAEISLPARRALRSITGQDVGGVANTEVARAVSSELALALKDQLPGPMSDGDRGFLMSIPPNIGNTREGNAALLFMSRRRYQYDQELAQGLQRFYDQNGGPSEANFRAWQAQARDQSQQNPLFNQDERRAVDLLLQGGQFMRRGNQIIVRDGDQGIVLEF